jgi:hypothetical protein
MCSVGLMKVASILPARIKGNKETFMEGRNKNKTTVSCSTLAV